MDAPHLLAEISDEEDLISAGVNSGEIILVSLECEKFLGRPLTDDELASLLSISDVASLLSGTH
jgi:hypothetical protein